MIQPTPIGEYLRKGSMGDPRKLLVLRGFRPFEEQEANWMADQVIRGMRSQSPDLEVSDMPISAFRLLAGVTNDPDDQHFDPKDQLPLFLDPLGAADAVLLASHETAGFPDSNMVRLTERMYQAIHGKDPSEEVQKAFSKPKMLGVVVYGGSGAYQAALTMAGAWARFGCMIPKRGLTIYDGHRGDIKKATDMGNQLVGLGRNLMGPRDAQQG